MISDRDVWAAALLIVKRYGEDAMREAEARAEQFQGEWRHGWRGTWHRPKRDRAAAGEGAG